MYCRYCGKKIGDNDAFCSGCGRPTGVTPGGTDRQSRTNQQPALNQAAYRSPQGINDPNRPYEEESRPDGYAIASLVLGILGIFAIPVVGGVLAIVFGNISRRYNGPTTMARVGKILGIIALVVNVVAIMIMVVLFVFLGFTLLGGWVY